MNKVKINFGFFNPDDDTLQLTGKLLSGKIEKDSLLILNNSNKLPIIDVKFDESKATDSAEFIKIMVSRYHNIKWYKLYGNEYEIEAVQNN